MSWKTDVEGAIKEQNYLNSFKSDKDVLDYIFKYFNNFFEVENSASLINVIQEDERVSISLFDKELIVEITAENIKFSCSGHQNRLLGYLFRNQNMRMYRAETQDSDTFSEEILERFMEIAFNPKVELKTGY